MLCQRGDLSAAATSEFDCPFGVDWGFQSPPKPIVATIVATPAHVNHGACAGDGPGSVVKKVFASWGIHEIPGCGCEEMCARMNAWGWSGCLLRLPTLAAWFSSKAADRVGQLTLAEAVQVIGNALRHGDRTSAAEQAIDGDSNNGQTAVRG